MREESGPAAKPAAARSPHCNTYLIDLVADPCRCCCLIVLQLTRFEIHVILMQKLREEGSWSVKKTHGPRSTK